MIKEWNFGMFKGVMLVTILAALALQLSHIPWLQAMYVSPLMIGILLGILFGNTIHHHLPQPWLLGIHIVTRRVLRLAIILYGFHVSLQEVLAIGWVGFLAAASIVGSTLFIAYIVGIHIFHMDKQTVMLTGAGSAICGAAAILAFEPIVQGKGHQTAASVATVIVFGTSAMFLYPLLYHTHFFDMSSHAWGIYIGATVHEVAQVVGAASAIQPHVIHDAVIVKMTRVMLLVPALLITSWWWARQQANHAQHAKKTLTIPWFAFGFLGMVLLNSMQVVPPVWVSHIQTTDHFLLIMAMTALGLETQMKKLKQVGIKPFILGFILFIWLIMGGYMIVQGLLRFHAI
ncbi:YeiH family protein [Ghiorsea bivora]|uniref:YeiH family protein n=1 Tax=Ghiorsea bivora TaxID=1485545 RepID=UPI00056E198C|nr:YeiH family protein [Ghiorsea bivora]